jgi:hypothetical protein
MSLALIQESSKEVRRLAIAGSSLAVGDFRLKKFIAPLEQAGVEVPVFAQVAKAMSELLNGGEADSAANLLNLSTLLNAILYTQGQTGAEGEFRPLEMSTASGSSTRTSSRVLKPVVEALTTTGGGRFEIVKSACERGIFHDLRLIDPAIHALGDVYAELADLVAEKVLPGYGPGIAPRLRAGLDLKGKKQDARRLQVMHRLDPEGTLVLCKTALEEGSPEVKAAAIACLGKHVEYLPLVLEQSKSKIKALRAAALEALAEHDRPEVAQLFMELVTGKSLDLLAGPFRALRNRQVLLAMLDEGRRVNALLLKGDSQQIPRFSEILDCLTYRAEEEVEEFLLNCLAGSDPLTRLKAATNSTTSGADMVLVLVSSLYGVGTPRALEAVLAKREELPPGAFPQILRSALRTWTPDKVFVEFSPLLRGTKGADKEKRAELHRVIAAAHGDDSSRYLGVNLDEADPGEAQALKNTAWDTRWLDAAIKADQATLVCCLARPNHPGALRYLLKLGEEKQTSDPGMAVRALVRCQYPKVTDFFLDRVTRQVQGAKYLDSDLQSLFDSARLLPADDLPRLDAFAATLEEKFMERYLEALAPLRSAPSSR